MGAGDPRLQAGQFRGARARTLGGHAVVGGAGMREATDLMFATDSIPAIFAVTLDPFIVYTSNVFAILGLRSLLPLCSLEQ